VSWILRGRQNRKDDKTTLFVDPHDHIGVRVATRGYYDSYRLRALEQLVRQNDRLMCPPGKRSVCLDIGANIGNHSVCFSRLFDRVVSFEPLPALCEVARANLLLNDIRNAEVMNVGLSSADAVADISMQPGNHGGSSLHPGQAHAGGRTVQVKLVRGDDLMPGLLAPDDRLTFIKIDVEGHEQEALGGLTATIAAHRPVIWFEAHSKAFAEATLAAIGGRAAYAHVYLFGDPVELKGRSIAAALSRITRGMQVGLTPLETVPDNKYLNLIASPHPLGL
jgi:FkbM family methyltransferase